MFIYVPFVVHIITLVTFVHIKAVDNSSVSTQVRFFGKTISRLYFMDWETYFHVMQTLYIYICYCGPFRIYSYEVEAENMLLYLNHILRPTLCVVQYVGSLKRPPSVVSPFNDVVFVFYYRQPALAGLTHMQLSTRRL